MYQALYQGYVIFVRENLGRPCKPSGFPQEAATPDYDYYDNWEEGTPGILATSPPEKVKLVELDLTPEAPLTFAITLLGLR